MEGLLIGEMVMMTLGSFNFTLSTAVYQELRRTTEYTWASQSRFGNKEAVQYTGRGTETIVLPGVIYPEWRGGTGQVQDLRNLAAEAQPLLLLDGTGNVYGNWVIEKVEENQSVFAGGGVARKQEFTISLKRYDDLDADDVLSSIASGIAAAAGAVPGATGLPAILPSLSATSSAADMVSSVSATANSALTTASRLAGQVGAAIGKVNGIAVALGVHAPTITKALARSQDVTNGIRTAAGDSLDILRRIQTVGSAKSAINGIFDSITTLTQPAAASGTAIKSSLASLTASGAEKSDLDIVTEALIGANKVTALASSVRDSANTIIKRIAA